MLDAAPAPSLVSAIHERTQGIPFFVEELGRALMLTEALAHGPRGLELADEREVPLPDTIRDAVLVGAAELSDEARAAAEVAAAAGDTFGLDVVAEVAGTTGLGELLDCGLLVEAEPGRGAFRHALAREALYADVPWLRRRSLHARLAEELEARDAPSIEVATQWQGAHEQARAREALLRAAEESRAVHAYRDAAHAGRRALELWAEDEQPDRRVEALDAYARSAELAGDLAEACRAWREIAAIRAEARNARAAGGGAAPARGDQRHQGRSRGGARRARRRGRGVRRRRQAGRGRRRAAGDGQLPARRRELRRRDRAGARGGGGGVASPTGSTCASAPWASRASPARRAASTTLDSRRSAAGWRLRSSTT